jgi:hypothetical protein
MSNILISEGRVESPASRADPAAAGDSTHRSPCHTLNPAAEGLSVPIAADAAGAARDVANATIGAGRSAIWRTGIHEASHICASRFQNLDVAGSTLVEGPDYQGLTWSSGSKRASRQGCL